MDKLLTDVSKKLNIKIDTLISATKFVIILFINLCIYISMFSIKSLGFGIVLPVLLTTAFDFIILCHINYRYRNYYLAGSTVFKYLLSIYYKMFGSFDFLQKVKVAKEATKMTSVVVAETTPILIAALLLAVLLLRFNSIIDKSEFNEKVNANKKTLLGVCAVVIFSGLFLTSNEIYSASLSTPAINKIRVSFQKTQPIDYKYINEVKTRNKTPENNAFTGIAKDKNILVIQVESFQNTFVNMVYNSQELTPYINSLINEPGTIYFDDYFQLTGSGNTSDAEYVSLHSSYPTIEGTSYETYYEKTTYGLPKIAASLGYDTIAMHGYEGSFYQRDKVYPDVGFKEIYLGESFDQTDQVNIGLSDESFFSQCVHKIAAANEKGNFFGFAITLTNHTPFTLDESLKEIVMKEKDKGSFIDGYFNTLRYTDNAIKHFMQALEQQGILQNTVVVIYGDHHGVAKSNLEQVEQIEKLTGKPYDFDTMMNIPLIIKVPGLEQNVQRHNIGSQIDLYPTLINLMGWDKTKIPTFGIDLLGDGEDVKNNAVFPQTYMLKGSFITSNGLFEVSRDNTFNKSRYIDRKTREPLNVEDARSLSEKSKTLIDYSNNLYSTDTVSSLLN